MCKTAAWFFRRFSQFCRGMSGLCTLFALAGQMEKGQSAQRKGRQNN